MQVRYQIPETPEDFETLCRLLFGKMWGIDFQKYGRRGHKQHGRDLIGHAGGKTCVIQCKHKDFHKRLTTKEVLKEIKKAAGHRPPIDKYVVATTAKRDCALQDLAIAKTREHESSNLFSVHVYSWDDINDELYAHPEVAQILVPGNPSVVRYLSDETVTAHTGRVDTTVCMTAAGGPSPVRRADRPPLESGEPTDVHAAIDEAGKHLENGRYDTALALLVRAQKDFTGKLTARCKYRIAANKGHIARLRGDYAKACALYTKAHRYQPRDPNAVFLKATALAIRGQTPQARRVALRILRDHPDHASSRALCLMLADARVPFPELESSVPSKLRHHSDVAMALGQCAAKRQQWKAAEKYTRAAMKASGTSLEPRIQLAEILALSEPQQSVDVIRPLPEKTHGRLREASRLLSGAIEGIEAARRGDYVVPRLKAMLGSMYGLLGDPLSASEQLITAYRAAPRDTYTLAAYAAFLSNTGKSAEALDVLRSLSRRRYTYRLRFLLAHVLSLRRDRLCWEEAAGLLEGNLKRARQMEAGFIDECVSLLVSCRLALSDVVGLKKMLLGPMKTYLSDFDKLYIGAEIDLLTGALPDAKNKAVQLLPHARSASGILTARRTALLLEGVGEYKEAYDIWRKIAEPTALTFETQHAIHCAQKIEDHLGVADFCRRLRRAGVTSADIIETELHAQSKVSPSLTLATLEEILSSPIDNAVRRELTAVKSYTAYCMGKHDLVDSDVSHLPAPEEVSSAQRGRIVVEVLRRGPLPRKAVEYAYELFRRFPNEVDSYHAVIASSNMALGGIALDTPSEVIPGAAVEYQDDDAEKKHWVIVEEGENPDIHRDERGLSDPLVKALLGKSTDERVVVRAQPRRTVTVLTILSKYVYRIRKCLEDMETVFPERTSVFSVHVPKDADGKPNVNRLIETLKEFGKRTENIIETYIKRPFTIHCLADVSGRSTIEAMHELVFDETRFLKCWQGTESDMQRMISQCELAKGVVLDPTSLVTLHFLQATDSLSVRDLCRCLAKPILVSELALLDLRSAVERRLEGHNQKVSIDYKRGSLIAHSATEAEIEQGQRVMTQYLADVHEHCVVKEATDLAAFVHDDKATLIDIMGRAGLHSAVMSRVTGYPLWTDDWSAAEIAERHIGTMRCSTQSIILYLLKHEQIAKETEQRATLLLSRMGYVYTPVACRHISIAAQESEWDSAKFPLNRVLQPLTCDGLRPDLRMRLAIEAIMAAWSERNSVVANNLIIAVLSLLCSASRGSLILDDMAKNNSLASQVLGPIKFPMLQRMIKGWQSSQKAIARP